VCALFLSANTEFDRIRTGSIDENQLLQCALSILLKKDENTFTLKKQLKFIFKLFY
jgi:hypothetical protein